MTPDRRNGTRLSRQVVERFLDRLTRGELTPGDRLPPERELADSFGVGRNSIREAIRELELLGLVESRRGDGTYVTEADARRLIAPFRGVMALSSSTATLREVLDFRRAIEPAAAALAATNLDPDGRELLERALVRFDRSLRSDDDPRPADTHFHFAIARASRNSLMIAVGRTLIEVMADFRDGLASRSYEPSRRAARGHRAVFDAIVARDPSAAHRAMRDHLDEVAADLIGGGLPELTAPIDLP